MFLQSVRTFWMFSKRITSFIYSLFLREIDITCNQVAYNYVIVMPNYVCTSIIVELLHFHNVLNRINAFNIFTVFDLYAFV